MIGVPSHILLGFQVIFGALVAAFGLYLAKDAVEAINDGPETAFAGIVGLLISSVGIVGGCLLALICLVLLMP